MTRLPFPLAFAALAIAAALNGCATTGTGGSDSPGAVAAEAQSSAIEGTRVVGLVAGVMRQSIMGFVVGIAAGLGVFVAPDIIDNIVTATLPIV
jgi:conjugal transfer pilus assembly protein TraA